MGAPDTSAQGFRGLNKRAADGLFLLGVVLAVWLAWQIIVVFAGQRLPVELAARAAPGSPYVLSRAAQAEFTAERFENAGVLARDSLARAPFDVVSLRLVGLVEAKAGRLEQADDLVTLAGNWSLRDDPAHAWLVERRLATGNYSSAFAHADTLIRRRTDLQPTIFNLFQTAVTLDSRAMSPLTGLVAADPPWREGFLEYLSRSAAGLNTATNLALNLDGRSGRLSDDELSRLYKELVAKGAFAGLRELRQRLDRPSGTSTLFDGNFTGAGIAPFAWTMAVRPGMSVELLPADGLEGENALRAEHNGYSTAPLSEQLLLLEAGRYTLAMKFRVETIGASANTVWKLSCGEGGELMSAALPPRVSSIDWQLLEATFTVPPSGCSAQWLRLQPVPTADPVLSAAWYDDLAIRSGQRAVD